jgi:hypothetical protein
MSVVVTTKEIEKQQLREEIIRINQQTDHTDFTVLPDTVTKNWKTKFEGNKKIGFTKNSTNLCTLKSQVCC